jgi:hypothetical protein
MSQPDDAIVSSEDQGVPNFLDNNLRGGDRAEYLAQFILSAIGVSVQVPRPEDYGHDFFCALQRRDNRQLTFHSPFTVQTGTIGGKNFVYGAKKKDGKLIPRPEGIDFLRRLQLPFFLGVVDKAQHRLQLYSTSAMWRVLYQHEKVGRIELHPAMPFSSDAECHRGNLDTPDGPLPMFEIPLDSPVVDLGIADLDSDCLDKAIGALEYAVGIEQRNLVYRNLDVGCSWKLHNHAPNEAGSCRWYSFVPRENALAVTLDWLRPVIITLAMVYKRREDSASLEKLRGMLELLHPLSTVDKDLLRELAGIEL